MILPKNNVLVIKSSYVVELFKATMNALASMRGVRIRSTLWIYEMRLQC
jgi:hypothetical protein